MTRFNSSVASPWVRFGLVAAWALVLLYASVSDPSGVPLARSGPLGLFGLDKWLHAGAYAAFAVLLAYALLPRWRSTRRGLIAALLLAGGYGVAMEILQYPLASRSFDPLDATANVLGALAVVLAVALGSRIRDRFRGGTVPR
ncbi:MAG TPA: VanZ family protein [Natrialbaceae archaeon]|nr:VanZ family protein [Natrialbaceae archaeon]